MEISTTIEQEQRERNGRLGLQFYKDRFASQIPLVSEMDWLEELHFDDFNNYFWNPDWTPPIICYDGTPTFRAEMPPVDLSPLAKLKSLRRLSLAFAPIEDIMPLTSLPNLESLNLDLSWLGNFEPLAGMGRLQTLSLYRTGIDSLRPLERLPALSSLNIGYCSRIETLHYLTHLDSLEYLYMKETNLKDLSPLRWLPNLKRLDIERSKVTSLEPLRLHLERGLNVGIDSDIKIYGCPLTSPPYEVACRGRKATLKYLRWGKSSWWLPPW